VSCSEMLYIHMRVLQGVVVCAAMCCSVCCSELQCVAVRGSVLQCVAM